MEHMGIRRIHSPLAVLSQQQNSTLAVGRLHHHTVQINILHCSNPRWPAGQTSAHPAVQKCDERSDVTTELWTREPEPLTWPDIL